MDKTINLASFKLTFNTLMHWSMVLWKKQFCEWRNAPKFCRISFKLCVWVLWFTWSEGCTTYSVCTMPVAMWLLIYLYLVYLWWREDSGGFRWMVNLHRYLPPRRPSMDLLDSQSAPRHMSLYTHRLRLGSKHQGPKWTGVCCAAWQCSCSVIPGLGLGDDIFCADSELTM